MVAWWMLKRLFNRRQRVERNLRDLLLPTIRMHSAKHCLVLSDAEEERVMRGLLDLYTPGIEMADYGLRVRIYLKAQHP